MKLLRQSNSPVYVGCRFPQAQSNYKPMWVLKCSAPGDSIKPIFSTTVSSENSEFALAKEQQAIEKLCLPRRRKRKARPKHYWHTIYFLKPWVTAPLRVVSCCRTKASNHSLAKGTHPAEAARGTCASSKGRLAQGAGHFDSCSRHCR